MEDGQFVGRLTALAGVWDRWANVGRSLSSEDWIAPSRCPGWDVACLFAHHSAFPLAFSGPPPALEANPPEARLTARDVLRGFNQAGGLAHTMAPTVEDRAKKEAGKVGREEIVARFEAPARTAIDALRRSGADFPVPWPGSPGMLVLGEAVRIVLLEAVVHLLDVYRALGRTPELPEAALAHAAVLLAEMEPAVEFIEAATGRTQAVPLPVLR